MKKILVLLLICFAFQFNYSQESYTVNGETLQLKTEIDGELDLLWNIIDGEYRYFVRTDDGSITELKNSKNVNNKFEEEYKTVLSGLTNGMPTDQLKLTLFSLKDYLNDYNKTKDSGYDAYLKEGSVQMRLSFSGGITNNPFVGNPNNIKTPMIGAELEIFEANDLPRHSGFLQARHAFESDDFAYSTTEFSLGYRFRFIIKERFSIYAQAKLATVNFSNATITDEPNMDISINETAFDIPIIFGIGSDIKIGDNSYITLIYGELFALLIDNQGNFSTDIAVGYKFNL
jgi:hypothetical protein